MIVVYPKQSSSVEYPYDDMDINFIQIEANADEIYKHNGYDELRNQIEDAISKIKQLRK